VVKGQHGWLQGYNAQAAVNEHQIVIAAEIAVVSSGFGHLAPMVAAARRELAAAGITDAPKVVLADSGYLHTEQMHAWGRLGDRPAPRTFDGLRPPATGRRRRSP
jgi:hypothetical protein